MPLLFQCIAYICLQQMTSTIPDRIDWNMVDQQSGDILLVRWMNADTTLNLEYKNGETTCWLYDGNGNLNCPDISSL